MIPRVAFVTGLKAESRLIESAAKRAGHAALAVFCAGADAARARGGAARLIAQGARAIVSFGLCGGLDLALRPGTLILAEAVVERDGRRFDIDPDRRRRLLDRLQSTGERPLGGAILGSDRPVVSRSEKARLRQEGIAVAVDMESHGVARAAEEAGLPFLVLRAVADPAGRDLPRAALVATGADGGVRAATLAGAILRRPWEIGAMVRLAGDARAGFAALERAAPVLLGSG